jgi:hypothetical protein
MNILTNVLPYIFILPLPFVFFGFIYLSYDRGAKRIIAQLPADIVAQYADVRIWFKDYDALKKVNMFQLDPSKALYSYNLADLYLFKDGIVVAGKQKQFGKIWLLPPFAIRWKGGVNQLSMVRYSVQYIGLEVIGEDIDIKFQDPAYTNIIKLAVKNVGPALYRKMGELSVPDWMG